MFKNKIEILAKGLVTELAFSHVHSSWESRGEGVQVAGLTACCNWEDKWEKLKT